MFSFLFGLPFQLLLIVTGTMSSQDIEYDEWSTREYWWFEEFEELESVEDEGVLMVYGEEAYDNHTGEWLSSEWISSENYYDSQNCR